MSDPRETAPMDPARRLYHAEQHQVRMLELQQLAKQISDLEVKLSVARSTLDGQLYYLHEDGVAIAELARNARRSRETIYTAIDRYRAERPVTPTPEPTPFDGFSDRQLDGFACRFCGVADDRPMVIAGDGPRGQLFAHSDCVR